MVNYKKLSNYCIKVKNMHSFLIVIDLIVPDPVYELLLLLI